MKIVYVGRKSQKGDNVAQTGLIWTPGQIHDVSDEKKALKLLEHKLVWADADKPYDMVPELVAISQGGFPMIEIIPAGETGPVWEPVKLTVDKDVFEKVRAEELLVLFVTPENADAFAKWKALEDAKAAKRDKKAA